MEGGRKESGPSWPETQRRYLLEAPQVELSNPKVELVDTWTEVELEDLQE